MKKGQLKIVCVAGARPNFMKIAPLMRVMKKHQQIKAILVHTGQHYDDKMSLSFFQELGIPEPRYNLIVGSGTHAGQTAKVIQRIEPVFLKEKPALVIVVGDVNSTMAAALTAAKLQIKVAHIESGLRSFDRTMPEEINRILTDQVSDFLFASEPSAVKNLKKEGVAAEKIHLIGNVMIDTLRIFLPKIQRSAILARLNLKPKQYAVLTLHRPSNVDNKKTFTELLEAFHKIQKKIKVVYPVHPRAKKQIQKFGFENRLTRTHNLILTPPLPYFDMIKLIKESKLVLTDSGGVQEETTFLRVPCLTLRENTERPITVEKGTNTICSADKNFILKQVNKVLAGRYKKGTVLKLWDGKTAKRIIKIILEKYEAGAFA